MTFNPAAWAIDGARLNSALARTEAYAAASGSQGIIQKGDLKVATLDTPGNGLKIGAGSALILNGYQGSSTDQMYTVTNPDVHTVTSGSMPAANASAKSYILAVVIGDAEYSQAGHPFMLATDPPAGQEDTFVYVRPVMIPVADATVTSLNVGYPALPLARIDIPANTTTITSSMIVDIRNLARPRTWLAVGYAAAPNTENGLNVTTANSWERFPDVNALSVKIPDWAVKAKVMGFVEGLRLDHAGNGSLQPYIVGTSLVGGTTNLDEFAPKNQKDRRTYNVGGEIDVTSVAGTTKGFAVRGKAGDSDSKNFLLSNAATSVMLQVYFEEQPT